VNNKLTQPLRQLGWGFVLTLLDIRIINFDILPDLLGYIMIALALHHIVSIQPQFSKAKWVAYAMILLATPGLFIQSHVPFAQFSSVPLQLQIYSQALFALHACLVYQTFRGLEVMARQARLIDLLETVITRRNLYLTVSFAELLFYPFLLNMEASWSMLLILIIILMLIMEILFIRLPFRFSRIETPKSIEYIC
jgi:hypothetical protein